MRGITVPAVDLEERKVWCFNLDMPKSDTCQEKVDMNIMLSSTMKFWWYIRVKRMHNEHVFLQSNYFRESGEGTEQVTCN